jgi:protein gp37
MSLRERPAEANKRSVPGHWEGDLVLGKRPSAVERAAVLRDVPAAVRFLSCEPLLGPLPSLELTGID